MAPSSITGLSSLLCELEFKLAEELNLLRLVSLLANGLKMNTRRLHMKLLLLNDVALIEVWEMNYIKHPRLNDLV